MQVANALNNNIRILFNPKVEAFKLFDFLIVKSNQDRYIAQIIEIYDDKFDSSQNVAKLKLFYKITENNEVMPYDNFTPNKECEIVKIKQEEIENFINQDRETFIFATNAKNSCSLKVQYDFFNNGAIVLADKIENANAISLNLAKNLSVKKHAIIIDSTGIIEFENAKKIKASKDFKMPLNYTTIDYVFDRCLQDASLEFQAIGGEIINEIKKFAKKQQTGFIPFNAFTRVLLEQYKATPYPELKLLLVRLKKYQMDEIFARTKKDNETLFKTIEKNPITIIDLSGVDASWQKAYLEYIVDYLEEEVYLISRINDENCDVNLINKIYNEKKNINFVPNVSYNYKKLPTIMQYCKNYILMPSLYQRTDFLDANFALSNLIAQGCIIFGDNTDNFLYLARDYELEIQEKRKNYRKIALSLANEDEKDVEPKEENITTTDSEKLIAELTRFEQEKLEQEKLEQEKLRQKIDDNFDKQVEDESFEEIENPKTTEELQKDTSKDDFFDIGTEDKPLENTTTESNDEFQELEQSPVIDKIVSQDIAETADVAENKSENEPLGEAEAQNTLEAEFENIEEIKEENPLELQQQENISDDISAEITDIKETAEAVKEPEKVIEADIIEPETKELHPIEEDSLDLIQNEEQADESFVSAIDSADLEIKTEEENKMQTAPITHDAHEIELSDEELDFFQIAKESSIEYEKENDTQEEIEYKVQNDDAQEDDIDLSDIANNSLDNSFEQIINTKSEQEAPSINIDENTKIDANVLENPAEKDNLPIFKEEVNADDETPVFKVGDVVRHKKYGAGTVTKTIKYEQRQLVQVEFEESGKKLLDPKVADLKLEQ